MKKTVLNTLMIKDLLSSEELDSRKMAKVHGGMMKRPFQQASASDLLTTSDGDPVSVSVDGVLVNSLTTGYAPR